MPRCDHCHGSVASTELAPMPAAINVLACKKCRTGAPHLKTIKKAKKVKKATEDKMFEGNKPLFAFTISEVEKKSNKDYRFDFSLAHAGMNISLGCSMDEVRDFLSRRRAAKEEKVAVQG